MGAKLTLVIGDSGAGKTSSLRYIDPKTTALITPNSKDLPIPGLENEYQPKKHRFITTDINMIKGILQRISDTKPDIKLVVIDDLNHFFNAVVTSTSFRAKAGGEEGWSRWGDFGADVADNLINSLELLRDDLSVAIFAHTTTSDSGEIVMQTAGKLLDNTIKIPGYSTCIFHAMTLEKSGIIQYKFLTNKDGIRLAKTPAGMFKELHIPNDLKLVLDRIKEYKKGGVEAKWID